MIRKDCFAIIALSLVAFGCSGVQHPVQPDVVEVTLPASADRVKAAVTKVLAEDDYCCVDWDGSQLKTSYRGEQPSIWDWLVRGRFGVVRSQAEASVTEETNQSSRLRLQVSSEGKQTMFDSWGPTTPQVPQSAQNKLRLIKNELKIVQTTYTTDTFYGAK
ncbi:MAG: hypothetical protein A4C66_02285 [Nitrospira sp. HN-bin3]|jgi:hypothetical protein|uniref:hypothetical protein n=1 Tax=Nitrospira cf. moscoviensis SBR1015 TaxID=96242 RepID=UPI000A0B4BDD|nr:hypothetical protein [Nitrospira cf. moscoviensis SBR1015]OQW40534.1 MAG: hypothetical protein A4C66_02285 [Nitrospira sp. HN-bin3]